MSKCTDTGSGTGSGNTTTTYQQGPTGHFMSWNGDCRKTSDKAKFQLYNDFRKNLPTPEYADGKYKPETYDEIQKGIKNTGFYTWDKCTAADLARNRFVDLRSFFSSRN